MEQTVTTAAASLSPGQHVQRMAIAARAYAFPASIVPVLLGTAFAWYEGIAISWLNFALALIGGVLFQAACNLINDYYDHKYAVDRPESYGGSGMLVSGEMAPRQFAFASVATLAAGVLIGLFLAWRLSAAFPCGWPLLAIGGAGVLATIFYTATPKSAKYNALGEPLVFIMMGTGYVLGAYLVQAQSLSWAAVWVSVPVGFLVAAILQANDARDIADDRASNIKTISILLGPTGARVFTSVLLFAPYPSVLALCLAGVLPWPALICLLSLPAAFTIHKLFWAHREEKHAALAHTPVHTAQLHLLFGLLLSLGVVLGRWFH
jgi:1,4-dihydroxy-2-naphthoate polyprenyltransferase